MYTLRMQQQTRRRHSTDRCGLLIHNELVSRGMPVNQANMPYHLSIPAVGCLTRYNTTGLLTPLSHPATCYAAAPGRPSCPLVNGCLNT
ncbi:MAG: hypothetical protein ACMUIL_13110 [bacterium]